MKFFTLTALSLVFLISISVVHAQVQTQTTGVNTSQTQTTGVNTTGTNGSVTLENPLGTTSLATLVQDILALVTQIGSVVIVFMIIYVGYLFVIARGEPGKLTEARQALLWTIVGALILLGSQAIASAIASTVSALKS